MARLVPMLPPPQATSDPRADPDLEAPSLSPLVVADPRIGERVDLVELLLAQRGRFRLVEDREVAREEVVAVVTLGIEQASWRSGGSCWAPPATPGSSG